jgi:DNA gyrase/topoisomerase IV subunit B
MPELIERGHIFIAQPPLYKTTRGKSERYIKNEHEFEDFLVSEGVENAVLTLHTGAQVSGPDLALLVEHARAAVSALEGFPQNYPRFVLEQAAIAGALNPDILSDAEKANAAAAYIARRLDVLSTSWSAAGMASRRPMAASNSGATCAACAKPSRSMATSSPAPTRAGSTAWPPSCRSLTSSRPPSNARTSVARFMRRPNF